MQRGGVGAHLQGRMFHMDRQVGQMDGQAGRPCMDRQVIQMDGGGRPVPTS